MEVVWRVVVVILNCQFTASIIFHDVLHGSRAGCRTGTATLDTKLFQQLDAIREEVLYVIFIYIHKTDGDLYRYICLEILEGYVVGPWFRRIL